MHNNKRGVPNGETAMVDYQYFNRILVTWLSFQNWWRPHPHYLSSCRYSVLRSVTGRKEIIITFECQCVNALAFVFLLCFRVYTSISQCFTVSRKGIIFKDAL